MFFNYIMSHRYVNEKIAIFFLLNRHKSTDNIYLASLQLAGVEYFKKEVVMMARISVICLMLCAIIMIAHPMAAYSQEKSETESKSTLDNLMSAYNGESNANARYLAFAVKADAEGYAKVASLFRAAARAEQVHFEHHAAVITELGGVPKADIQTPEVKSTLENLQAAMNGEVYESTVMYPEFLAKAKADGIKHAVDAFEDAGAAEAVHASWYKRAIDNFDGWKTSRTNFYVCPVCGNIVDVIPGMECPICNTDTTLFMLIN